MQRKIKNKMPIVAEVNEQLIEIIVDLHCFFSDYKKIAAWLKTDNLNLGGASPLKLIKLGRGHRVLEFIRDANEKTLGEPPGMTANKTNKGE